MTESAARVGSSLADHYHIERELGAGGMATVYLAEDLKHHRKVAIKVLHAELSAILGPERFLKEIELTANLQHPHILPLFDSGSADGLLYYVMPYVDGETLRTRLDREHQLPIADAIRIASEVADALEYAHKRGVVHRDIKPENILLHDGRALVADFGIALAVEQAGGQRMTQTGLSLGTPQYMSPEQAMGERNVDARTDIYALGAVAYEMLCGDPPFTGSSMQAIVAKVMTERPTPMHTTRDTVPPGVENAVLTALAKLPADRFSSAADFATALGETSGAATVARSRAERSVSSRKLVVPGLVLVSLAAIAAALWGWLRPVARNDRVLRLAVAMPPGQEIEPQFFGFSFDLTRDGTRLAYVGEGATTGTTQIWVRAMDALDARPVAGTDGALSVAWSPDGRSLLFNGVGVRSSAVADMESGQIVRLPDVDDGSWGSDGALYAVRPRGYITRQQVGGAPDTIARIDSTQGARPLAVFPDGSGALFVPASRIIGDTSTAQIQAVSFRTGKTSIVGNGVQARILPTGQLLRFSADGTAYLTPFDAKALRATGPGVPVARVALSANSGSRSYPQISVANDGTMMYLSGLLQRRRLVWLDASGRATAPTDVEGYFWGFALSPDGTQLAFSLKEGDNALAASGGVAPADIWVEQLKTGARTRLTSAYVNLRPSWSADGKYMVWVRVGGAASQSAVERRSDASEPERTVLTRSAFGHSVGEARWLPDHRTLMVATYGDEPTGRDIYYVTPNVDSTPHPFAVTEGDQVGPTPSPDGSLVAYSSGELGGVRELYVQSFPSGATRLQVSNGGASAGRWSHDGRTLCFWDHRGKLMAASVASYPTLAVTGVRDIGGDGELLGSSVATAGQFDVTPDARVLVAAPVRGAFQLILVHNWMAGLTQSPKR